MRYLFFIFTFLVIVWTCYTSIYFQKALWTLMVLIPFTLLGLYDSFQIKHTITRNFPILGHVRFLLESIRPELHQYFIESDTSALPFSREQRSLVYQRAKQAEDLLPLGPQIECSSPRREWILPSMHPTTVLTTCPRIQIGNDACKHPYSASLFQIAAMSFGALSAKAILALNLGAKWGKFAQNTGEGGVSPYHLRYKTDLIWQIGTGYFSCRNDQGQFDPKIFQKTAYLPNIKAIELKLSQGASAGTCSILPRKKVTKEIAKLRNVPFGKDIISPAQHTAFHTPRGLFAFIRELRDLSGGKPIGIKCCLGNPVHFLSICKAMLETETIPDFLTLDGMAGGTGASWLEFCNFVGMPIEEALYFVHQSLRGLHIRKHIRIIVSGKIFSGFHMAKKLALGADICEAARPFMFALGCVQARKCHTNRCPTGVSAHHPFFTTGLHVREKAKRVFHFHHKTIQSFLSLLASTGKKHPNTLEQKDFWRRDEHGKACSYQTLFPLIEKGSLLKGTAPEPFQSLWKQARTDVFL